ncbi:hypothetical protein EXIGLDRAFT_759356 [Exidia glandulosa HHB12029]|uniref:F-box domain-containing protein n=1 Tax=Exidia glandulosa HHB12029 TaxID=1314781 RepID=A0A165Q3Z2_EXIGL|nr:hypothetical protein EXIGLDRAFT_759356 [Exidia glandulosa HHB12029]
MEHLFRNFSFVYNARSIAEEQPNDLYFFAAARGIVALATWGDFDLVSYPLLSKITYSECRNINPEWIWDPTLRTVAERIQPTHFWHRGVLFVLDSGLEDDNQLRGAIGRTVHLWRECADTHKRTVAFVITLRELVQVDLSNDEHVTHTTPVPLVSRNLLPQYDDDDFSSECTGFPVEMKFTPTSPGFAMLKATLTPKLPASELSSIGPFPVDVLERLLDWCEADTLAALGETCKSIRTLWLNRPRFDVGPYRLLHSVGDGVFTALDACGDTASVLVGGLRFSDYNKEGGCGHNLRLFIGGRQERVGTDAELIGLSVRPAEKEVLDPGS